MSAKYVRGAELQAVFVYHAYWRDTSDTKFAAVSPTALLQNSSASPDTLASEAQPFYFTNACRVFPPACTTYCNSDSTIGSVRSR